MGNIMRRYKALKSPFKRQVSFAGASKMVRVLGKKTSRARENVMQRLGKTIRSKNEEITEHSANVERQKEEVNTLNEIFKEYVAALENIKSAESKLMATWAQNIHDWENLENFLPNAEVLEKEVIVPMMTYKDQFAEIKGRIDKCEAKRMEFDRCNYMMQQQETKSDSSGEKIEGIRYKVDKTRDAYEALVNELNTELPDLYGARREFFASNLQNLFTLQKCFHNDVSYIFRDMSEYVLIKLKND